MELHFVKNNLRFSSEKMFVSLEKQKLLKPEFMRTHPSLIDQRMKTYLIDIVNTYTECFVLKFLRIVYCLYWYKAYETVLGTLHKKLGVVLFLLFYCSHRRRLLLQSMQNSSNCRLENMKLLWEEY